MVVKELHFAHLSDWKHLELFEREAKTLARLAHPGIPRCFDYFQGSGESATFYIVQEHVEGPSLLQRMESGPMLGQKEIREIATGLLGVLDYLHGRAPPVIHRDIKPSNVLLRPDGTPALIDFGGMRAWQPAGAAGATVVGTFGYMAPEQAAGQATPASDLYALGATLLHAVTGLPPSAFPFDSGRIEVPDDLPTDRALASLIEALLRPAPRDRPGSAQAALALLMDPAPQPPRRALAPSPERRPAQLAAAPPRKSIFGASGEPRFVDLGDPPRDPRGEFRDVYRNLMHPYFPARRAWSDSEHIFWMGLAGAASLVSLGTIPIIYVWLQRKRRKQFDGLFRFGTFTRGTIRSIPRSDIAMATMIRYEFDAGRHLVEGYFEQPGEIARYWSAGDTVGVLYDPDDPSRSCLVHR